MNTLSSPSFLNSFFAGGKDRVLNWNFFGLKFGELNNPFVAIVDGCFDVTGCNGGITASVVTLDSCWSEPNMMARLEMSSFGEA